MPPSWGKPSNGENLPVSLNSIMAEEEQSIREVVSKQGRKQPNGVWSMKAAEEEVPSAASHLRQMRKSKSTESKVKPQSLPGDSNDMHAPVLPFHSALVRAVRYAAPHRDR